MDNTYISIEKIIKSLKKGWIFILAVVIVTAGISVYYNLEVLTDTYATNAKLFVGKEISEESSEYNTNDITMYQKLLETYGEILLSRDLIENAIKSSNLDIEADTILAGLSVSPRNDTQLIDLYYSCGNAKECKKVLDAIIKEFMIEAKELIPNANIKVVTKPQVPTTSIGPQRKSNVIKAVLSAFLVASALVVIVNALDNRIRAKEDIEEILGVTILGSLPEYTDRNIKKDIKVREKAKKCYTVKNMSKAFTQNALEK